VWYTFMSSITMSRKIQADVNDMMPKLWQVRGWTRDRAPCNFPCSLMRSDIAKLKQSTYSVGPKADGERYFMLFSFVDMDGDVEDDYIALVDRTGRVRYVNGVSAGSEMYSGTLLDGELVTDEASGVMTYLVFDIIAREGVPMASEPHSSRVANLTSVIKSLNVSNPKLQIRPKPWFTYGDVTYTEVIDSIAPIKCDGLVFVPEFGRALRVGRQVDHYKWKWCTDNTIDFVFDKNEFWTESRGVRVPVSELGIRGEPYTGDDGVVECMVKDGVATVVRRRPDKTAPNDMEIALLTLKNIEEKITLEELMDEGPPSKRIKTKHNLE